MQTWKTRCPAWLLILGIASQGVSLLAGAQSTSPSSPASRPNVLFILIDDLGWSDIGCYGSKIHETPNVDQLAREGMTFTDFYSAGPVCSPTRGSVLTGRNPARLGISTYLLSPERDAPYVTSHLPLEETTIAEVLKSHGYRTGYFGKWHLGYENQHWASNQGFEVALGGMDLPWAWQLCWPERTAPMLDRARGHTRFFSPHHLTHLENGPEGEYLTDRLTREAIDFMRDHREQPFLAFVSYHTVHTPLQAKPEVEQQYREKIQQLGLLDIDEAQDGSRKHQNLPSYAAMVHHMDENVGRLVNAVKDLGLDDRTLIVFTSDNGGKGSVTSNAPLRGCKHDLDEGGIRVPTVIRHTGKISADSRCVVPLISDDFFPTILEYCGLEVPSESVIDGQSFAGILVDEDAGALADRRLYWHYPHKRFEGAIREGDYKLLYSYKNGRRRLYDLRGDVGESHDLSGQQMERTERMVQRHVDWLERVGARFPDDMKRPG